MQYKYKNVCTKGYAIALTKDGEFGNAAYMLMQLYINGLDYNDPIDFAAVEKLQKLQKELLDLCE